MKKEKKVSKMKNKNNNVVKFRKNRSNRPIGRREREEDQKNRNLQSSWSARMTGRKSPSLKTKEPRVHTQPFRKVV